MEKYFLPLLRICRENLYVARKHKKDPAWAECLGVCIHNCDLMETKWHNTVEATGRMRQAVGLRTRPWPR
jgi:hypothetical protein